MTQEGAFDSNHGSGSQHAYEEIYVRRGTNGELAESSFRSGSRSRSRSRDRRSRSRSRSRSGSRSRRYERDSESWDDRDRHRDRERNGDRWRGGGSRFSRDRDGQKIEPNNTVIVKGLPIFAAENTLWDIIKKQGFAPRDIRVLKHKDTGTSKGFAFVEFHEVSEAGRWIEFNQERLRIDDRCIADLQYSFNRNSSHNSSNNTSTIPGFGGDFHSVDNTPQVPTVCPWLSGAPPPGTIGIPTLSKPPPTFGPPYGDWICSQCGTNNFKKRDSCFKCNISRQESEWNSQSLEGFNEVGTNVCDTILVRNLGPLVTEDRLLSTLRKITTLDVARAVIAKKLETGLSLGYGFIQMRNNQEATQLLTTLTSMTKLNIDGKDAVVSFARLPLDKLIGEGTDELQIPASATVAQQQAFVQQCYNQARPAGGWKDWKQQGGNGNIGSSAENMLGQPLQQGLDSVNVAAAVAHNAMLKAQATKQLQTVVMKESVGNLSVSQLAVAAKAASVLVPASNRQSLQLHHLLINQAMQEQMAVAQIQAQVQAQMQAQVNQVALLQAAALQQQAAAQQITTIGALTTTNAQALLSAAGLNPLNLNASNASALVSPVTASVSVQTPVSSTVRSGPLGTVKTAQGEFPKFPPPDPNQFQLEESSGYYFDRNTGLYYDANSQYYYNSENQKWHYWHATYQTYLPVGTAGENEDASATSGELKEKDKTEKVKTAKQVQKDMQKWLKEQEKQKRLGKSVDQQMTSSSEAHQKSATADAGFAVLESHKSKHLPPHGLVAYDANDSDEEQQTASSSTKARDSSDTFSESTKAEVEQVAKAEAASMVDMDKLACLLCKRAFSNKETLTKHQQMSELHKQNVEQLVNSKLAMRGVDGGAAESSSKDSEQLQFHYRDRAKERRQKFGLDDQAHPNKLKEKYLDVKSSSYEQPTSAGIGSDNIGNKLLKSMGWKEGQGLGKAGQGIVDPIQAQQRLQGVGLGTPGAVSTGGPNYQDGAKAVLRQRYYEQE